MGRTIRTLEFMMHIGAIPDKGQRNKRPSNLHFPAPSSAGLLRATLILKALHYIYDRIFT